ncbi:MAG TPA: hypothetical protein VIK04_04855 [Solirubrobacteraceae bacterium]
MSRRTRTIRYGGSVLFILIGIACGVAVSGTAGGTLATVFVGLGLVGIISLIFYEVGLTEDRERSRPPRKLEDGAPPPLDSALSHKQRPGRQTGPEWLKERRRRSH